MLLDTLIILKRECGELSGLTEEETLDLLEIIKKMESSLKKAFGATNFNWTCLMNDEQKKEDPKPQVHLHLLPRYKNKVEFAGEVFIDEVFAHHYDKKKEKIVSAEVLEKISNFFIS